LTPLCCTGPLPQRGASPFYLAASPGGQQQAVGRLVAAVGRGVAHQPAFDELKLRLNLGKALFYKGVAAGQRMSVAQLQVMAALCCKGGWGVGWGGGAGLAGASEHQNAPAALPRPQARRVPTSLNTVFSNGLPAARAATLLHRLRAACPNLQQAESRQGLSLHLLYGSDRAYYALSFESQEGGWGAPCAVLLCCCAAVLPCCRAAVLHLLRRLTAGRCCLLAALPCPGAAALSCSCARSRAARASCACWP
jgi:hypothetical protein